MKQPSLDAGRLDVVYDGQCAFCIRVLRCIAWLARRDVFAFHDSNDGTTRAQFPLLAGEDFDEAMFVVASDGVFKGFFAFRRMMRASSWLVLPLAVMSLPGASRFGPAIYGWVARHRRSLGCATNRCNPTRAE